MAIEKYTLHRRNLFAAAATAVLGGAMSIARGTPAQAKAAMPPDADDFGLITGARVDGVDGGALWSSGGLRAFALPGRAHALLHLPKTEQVMVIGRRPGAFAALVDPSSRRPERVVAPLPAHRFVGHAALGHDGRIVTTEMHEETAEGVAVVRDGETGDAENVWPLSGLEPHDIVFADGGMRAIVALGGIARAAEVKGPPINAGKIESAILEMDARTGRVLKRHALPHDMRSLSLRHLAVAPDGRTVAFGMQDQDRAALRPLMGLLRPGGAVELLPLPAREGDGLRFYIGSVAFDASGAYVAATSPKGGLTGLWSTHSGRYLGGFALADVCGLAPARDAGGFWITSGHGDVVRLHAGDEGFTENGHWRTDAAFDNHMLRLS